MGEDCGVSVGLWVESRTNGQSYRDDFDYGELYDEVA